VLIFVDEGLIVTHPRAPANRPVPPVTGILMLGDAIEIRLPPASTFPPGSAVTVAKSASALQSRVNAVHCFRIVYSSRIDPTFE
jgi:hypothetical protein